MNTLRTILVFSILGAVGYGVYSTLTQKPPVDPPDVAPEDWQNAPVVQYPGQAGGPEMLGAGTPPPFNPASAPSPPPVAAPLENAPLGDAPPFNSAASAAPVPPHMLEQAQSLAEQQAMAAPPGVAPPDALAASPPGDYAAGAAAAAPEYPQTYPVAPGDPQQISPGDVAPPYTPDAGAMAPPLADPAAPPVGSGAYQAPPSDPNLMPAGQSAPATNFATDMQRVQQQLDAGRLADAHLAMSRWCDDPQLSDEQRRAVNALLDQLAGTVIYSREATIEPHYEVQPGDTLEKVAAQYNIPWQLLAKINGIENPHQLHTGERIKVVRGPFTAVVDLTRFQLTLWLDSRYAGRFPIGVGADQLTPTGTFEVKDKVENPIYYGPDRTIEADDPANPLGERWLSLGNQIGIHGTNEPQSLGKAESRGCIRMSEHDITDVYDILSVGSKVVIRQAPATTVLR